MKNSAYNSNLNRWFIINHEKYYGKQKEFKNAFLEFINSDTSDLKNLKLTDIKYFNILANMFLSVEYQYLKKYSNFNEFEKFFNKEYNSDPKYFINLGVISMILKNRVLVYINKLIYVTNFIGWKNNNLFLYPIITLMSEGNIYNWNGQNPYEVVTTKITKNLYNDFDHNFEIKDEIFVSHCPVQSTQTQSTQTQSTQNNINKNILNDLKPVEEEFKPVQKIYQINNKFSLRISPNSAFEPYEKYKKNRILKQSNPSQVIKQPDEAYVNLSKLNIKDVDKNPKKRKKNK